VTWRLNAAGEPAGEPADKPAGEPENDGAWKQDRNQHQVRASTRRKRFLSTSPGHEARYQMPDAGKVA
jgi:hypothetical protein